MKKYNEQSLSAYGKFPRTLEQAFPSTMQAGAAITGPFTKHPKTKWKTLLIAAFAYLAVALFFYVKG